MFVNGAVFLMMMSKKTCFMTVEYLMNRRVTTLDNSLTKIIQLYQRSGFVINAILTNMEFNKVIDLFPKAKINTTAAREHVENSNRDIYSLRSGVI